MSWNSSGDGNNSQLRTAESSTWLVLFLRACIPAAKRSGDHTVDELFETDFGLTLF